MAALLDTDSQSLLLLTSVAPIVSRLICWGFDDLNLAGRIVLTADRQMMPDEIMLPATHLMSWDVSHLVGAGR